jgi:hypothetical protein
LKLRQYFALCATASETDFAPLDGAMQRALSGIIGRLHAFLIEECKEPFEVREQCRGQVAHFAEYVTAYANAVCRPSTGRTKASAAVLGNRPTRLAARGRSPGRLNACPTMSVSC